MTLVRGSARSRLERSPGPSAGQEPGPAFTLGLPVDPLAFDLCALRARIDARDAEIARAREVLADVTGYDDATLRAACTTLLSHQCAEGDRNRALALLEVLDREAAE